MCVKQFVELKKTKVAERSCPFCLGVRKFVSEKEVRLETVNGVVNRSVDMYHCRTCKKRSFLFGGS